jgi:hypothetical protein
VKATSGAYLHHLTRMDTYIYIHFFHKNIGKDPFFTKPRVALNPTKNFVTRTTKKGTDTGSSLVEAWNNCTLNRNEEQLNRGLEHLHPKQGVCELNHGHSQFLTWYRVSHCMTHVRDYEPLHDARRRGLSYTGCRPKRQTECLLKYKVKVKLGSKISVRIVQLHWSPVK